MQIEFDPAKDADNRAKHGGLGLSDFAGFDSEPVVVADNRKDYGEPRYRAFGYIDGKGHSLAFTLRRGSMRLISFRRAHEKEMVKYDVPKAEPAKRR